jgi:hypothetical protein
VEEILGVSRDLCVSEWIREHLFLGGVFRIGKLHTTVGWHHKAERGNRP